MRTQKSNPLAHKLRALMKKAGVSQAQLARESGLSPSYISDLLNNKRGSRVSVTTIAALASPLKVSVAFLIEQGEFESGIR